MDIITSIQTVATGLQAASTIASTLSKIKDMSEVQSKVIEIQSALLEAQNAAISATAAQSVLTDKIKELENQIEAMNDWDSQKNRYELVSPWRGPAQVYALKQAFSNGESPHFLCTNCFLNSKRVILNPIRKKGIHMDCPSCGSSVDTGYNGIGEAKYAEEFKK